MPNLSFEKHLYAVYIISAVFFQNYMLYKTSYLWVTFTQNWGFFKANIQLKMVATTTLSMLTYSLSSFGVIALIYKLSKYIRIKNLTKSYFRDKTVLITGASSGKY